MSKTEPVGLLDIAPAYELVDVGGGQKLRVRGIPAKDFVDLFVRFPPLQGVMVGRGITVGDLIKLGPEFVVALCAAASGCAGDEKAEAVAAALPIETQADIIEAAWRLTFTRGFGPFAQRMGAVGAALSAEGGKAPDTRSPKASPSSAPTETQPSGASPQDKSPPTSSS